jgi:hypothetical protein
VLLVDTYVRAEFREMREPEFREVARVLEQRVSLIGKEFSYRVQAESNLELFYELEQGSLVSAAKILGVLAATYVAIHSIPTFETGLYSFTKTPERQVPP